MKPLVPVLLIACLDLRVQLITSGSDDEFEKASSHALSCGSLVRLMSGRLITTLPSDTKSVSHDVYFVILCITRSPHHQRLALRSRSILHPPTITVRRLSLSLSLSFEEFFDVPQKQIRVTQRIKSLLISHIVVSPLSIASNRDISA